MNQRIKKKLSKRLNFFHYKDYKYYLKCVQNGNTWTWEDRPLSNTHKPAVLPTCYAGLGGSWDHGSYAGKFMCMARDQRITEELLYGEPIWKENQHGNRKQRPLVNRRKLH